MDNKRLLTMAGAVFGLAIGVLCAFGAIHEFRTGDYLFGLPTAVFAIGFCLSSTIGLFYQLDPATLLQAFIRDYFEFQ